MFSRLRWPNLEPIGRCLFPRSFSAKSVSAADWHHLGGDPIELVVLPEDFSSVELAPLDSDHPVYVVPADYWQSARTTGRFSLVGCTVGPGFDFADFALLRAESEAESAFRTHHPAMSHLL